MRTCMTILEHKALQACACDRMVRRTCTQRTPVTILIVWGIVLIEKHEALGFSMVYHGIIILGSKISIMTIVGSMTDLGLHSSLSVGVRPGTSACTMTTIYHHLRVIILKVYHGHHGPQHGSGQPGCSQAR